LHLADDDAIVVVEVGLEEFAQWISRISPTSPAEAPTDRGRNGAAIQKQ